MHHGDTGILWKKTHDKQSNMQGTIHSENDSESRSVVFTLGDPMDYIIHGILQARILEWVAVLFSRGSSQSRDRTQVSHIAG